MTKKVIQSGERDFLRLVTPLEGFSAVACNSQTRNRLGEMGLFGKNLAIVAVEAANYKGKETNPSNISNETVVLVAPMDNPNNLQRLVVQNLFKSGLTHIAGEIAKNFPTDVIATA